MSVETSQWLNQNVLVGFGHQAWHFSADDQGAEANHYAGAIPAEDVIRRLFAWEAIPAELTAMSAAGMTAVPDHLAYVRSDNGGFLGINSRKWAPHQFADTLVGGVQRITGASGSGLGINSAGLLAGGAIGWVSVSLADTAVTGSGVEYLTNLLAFTAHNGSLASGFRVVNQLVVCDNTLEIALGESAKHQAKVRHTRLSLDRLPGAEAAMAAVVNGRDQFARDVEKLCSQRVSDAQWSRFVELHVPMPTEGASKTTRGATMAQNKREALWDLWLTDARVTPWQNTAFGVVQAVNTWAHHIQSVRGDRAQRNMLATIEGGFAAVDSQALTDLNRALAAS